MSEDAKAAKYEVFETSPSGTMQLCGRFAKFGDAQAMVGARDGQTKVVLYKGEIVWPPKS